MICYDIKNNYNRAFLTIWGRLLEQKAYSRDRTSHHIHRNPQQYLFALLHKKAWDRGQVTVLPHQ